MHKFEDIMDIENYDAFLLLVQAARESRLVCYIGAGMSLYFKRWGEPFEIIVENLINFTQSRRQELLHEKLPELYQIRYGLQILGANSDVEKGKAYADLVQSYKSIGKPAPEENALSLVTGKTYPQLGDMIEKIIKDCELRIVNEQSKQDTFNDWFCYVISNSFTEKDQPCKPFSFPPIYYLPYLRKCLRFITTNCDPSLHDVGVTLHSFDTNMRPNWAVEMYSKNLQKWLEFDGAQRIFYIHGNIMEPESLIMTQEAYDNAYSTITPVNFLSADAAARDSILFLGASMSEDSTVVTINKQISAAYVHDAHCIPVFYSQSSMDKCGLTRCKPIYLLKDYDDISVILHQLIRESSNYDNSCSWEQDLGIRKTSANDEALEKVFSESLTSDSTFEVMDFSEDMRDSILAVLYNRYLHKNGGGGVPTWTLCQINDRNFKFYDSKGPMHNYPLGNTIYMLGGKKRGVDGNPRIYNDEANIIIEELKRWMNDSGNRPSFKNIDNNGDSELKVRVILFSTMQSPEQVIKKITCILDTASILQTDKSKMMDCQKEFVKLIEELKGTNLLEESILFKESNSYLQELFGAFLMMIQMILMTIQEQKATSEYTADLEKVIEDTYVKKLTFRRNINWRGNNEHSV